MTKLPQPLRGIVPPLLTPFRSNREVDVAALETLINRMIDGGVHGIFALGTTGEGPQLPHRLRHQIVEYVCEMVAGRVPVLVCISDTCFEEAVELADQAHSAGAAGVVKTAPYYLPMDQAELAEYTLRLTDRSPLPLLLYNMPSCTKVEFAPATVRQLGEHPKIVGLKDSSGDLEYFKAVVEACHDLEDFALFVGPEEILVDSMRLGGHGGVHGGANLFPRLYVDLYEAALNGNQQRVDQLQAHVMQISKTLYSVGPQRPSRIIKGIKTAGHLLGICEPTMLEPFSEFNETETAEVAQHLQDLLPILKSDDVLTTKKM